MFSVIQTCRRKALSACRQQKAFTLSYLRREVLHVGSSDRVQTTVFRCKLILPSADLPGSTAIIYNLSCLPAYLPLSYLVTMEREDERSPQLSNTPSWKNKNNFGMKDLIICP